MTGPRQHHFIPRCYLRGFADETILAREHREVIWVYERGKDTRYSSPNSEARERDYYAYLRDGVRNDDFESWLGNLESAVAPILLELSSAPRKPTDSEKQVLAVFVGVMHMRTPSGRYRTENRIQSVASTLMRDAAEDPERFRTFAEENDLALATSSPDSLEDIRRDILAGVGDQLAEQDDFNLYSIVEIGKMVADVLLNMSWQVISSTEHQSFLTTDDPVATYSYDSRTNKLHPRVGVAYPGANVWFPLCRTACLRIAKDEPEGVGSWVPVGVRRINKLLIQLAERWVYASEKSSGIRTLVEKELGRVSVKNSDLHFDGQRY